MSLQNKIRKITALLLAGAMLMPAGWGTYVFAGEDPKEAEISFVREEDQEGEIFLGDETTAAPVLEEEIPADGELLIPDGAVPSNEPEKELGGVVCEETPADILIEGAEIVDDPAGSADTSEAAGTWNEEALHKVGLAVDSSGAVPITSGGVSAILEKAVYGTCYGDQLEGESRKIYEALKKAWKTDRGTEDVTYTLSDPIRATVSSQTNVKRDPNYIAAADQLGRSVSAAVDALLYDYPEVFWAYGVVWGWDIVPSYDVPNTVEIHEVTIGCDWEYYKNAMDDVARFDSAVDTACQEISAGLAAGSSQEVVVKAIHDYICGKVTYDQWFISPYAHTAAGFFLYPESKIVCEGYAKAFKILCDRFGIECALVAGDAGGAHMWNNVKMEDGVWYLVDVTFDDQDDVGMVMDTYFLAGSGTIGFQGVSIAEERVIHKQFSTGEDAKEFEPPMLSAQKYTGCVHDWKEEPEEGEAPSCEEDGTAEYICEKCGATEIRLLPAWGHDWSGWETAKEASCTEAGLRTRSCSICEQTEQEEIKALGHLSGDWEIVKEANCVQKGEKVRKCTVCGAALEEQEIPRTAGVVKLNVKKIPLKVKQSTTAVKVIKMAEGDSISSWKSSNKKIALVTSAGKITGKKAGTAKVTVTLKSGVSASVTVSVQKGNVKTTGITVAAKTGTVKNKKLTLKKGAKETLLVTLAPLTSKEKISFSSSNSKIVKVSGKGQLTAKKAGKAKITVKAGKKKTVVTVTVK